MGDEHSEHHDRACEVDEVVALQKETADLSNLWNAYIEHLVDGRIITGIHPPPAFMAIYTALIGSVRPLDDLVACVEQSEENWEVIQATLINVVAFGDMMLRFGQWCASNGLLYANATPCRCGTVTDDALKVWLAGPAEGGTGA